MVACLFNLFIFILKDGQNPPEIKRLRCMYWGITF